MRAKRAFASALALPLLTIGLTAVTGAAPAFAAGAHPANSHKPPQWYAAGQADNSAAITGNDASGPANSYKPPQ
jgi:hypothetical protein